jgi:hypothetical protein
LWRISPAFCRLPLDHVDPSLVARTLSAWSIAGNIAIVAMRALWGVLASITSPPTAIAGAGVAVVDVEVAISEGQAGRRQAASLLVRWAALRVKKPTAQGQTSFHPGHGERPECFN